MSPKKSWMMELDRDIISHLDNKVYLNQLIQVLMGKVEAINLLSKNPEAKAEILNGSRVQRFLTNKEKVE